MRSRNSVAKRRPLADDGQVDERIEGQAVGRNARSPPEPQRPISDNAFAYRKNRSLRELLERNSIRHLLIPIRRPQVNGKVERYQQTLKREWALGQIYRSSDHRTQALSHWLNHYNERRPHSSLGGHPPISRVHNLPRQDS